MRITSCVPLAGHGVIARYGPLVAVTDGLGPGPDLLLSAVAETAGRAGDGADLVIKAARAALNADQRTAWACAGVTADGGLAVLVYGRAAATVRIDDGPEVTLTVGDTMLPVSRTFTGGTVNAILVIGGAAPPDGRFWLGDGVVPGGGLAVTASAGRAAPPYVPAPEARPADWRLPPTDTPAVGTPAARTPAARTPAGSLPAEYAADETGEPGQEEHDAVQVEGALCASGHFNDPRAWSCRQCGIGLEQPPRHLGWRPRPPLGELVLDDGTRVALDGDYVLGREPALDGEVLAGRARPLRINDPSGTVSRLHLKVSLVGWQVEVADLGSANGSLLQSLGEERTLTPFEPAVIEPGARIEIGQRSVRYVVDQGA
ncbi:MAG TPA: FHA domain-containing protein [Trebonia sp.]|nr:FHA domain-containing protein [Trebonia sp.]